MKTKKASKVSRKTISKKKQEDHYSGFFIKPRNVFLAGVIILLLVVAVSFTQIKTSQTGLVIKTQVAENSIRNLQEVGTDFGKICSYELFKNGEWTSGHTSLLSCEKLAEQSTVVS